MNKILKIAAYLAGAVILLLLVAIAYLQLALPSVNPAPELTIEYTPDRVEQGAYLANHVTVCMDCHSTRDFSEFSGPPTPWTIGAGGDRFDHSMGLPGVFRWRALSPDHHRSDQ